MSFTALNAHDLGVTIGALMIPLVGLTLLIVGTKPISFKQPARLYCLESAH